MNDDLQQLINLYNLSSKHSNYQILASDIQKVINIKDITVQTRYEKERLDYISKIIDFYNRNIVDVGGNTGYFSFETLKLGAKSVNYYEGNFNHATFVKKAAEVLGYESQLHIYNQYLDFHENGTTDKTDVMLLLNVLHHIGDDYGNQAITKYEALNAITRTLRWLSTKVQILVFQLGFNWKGNITLPLFEHGEKRELIDFVNESVDSYWQVKEVGIAVKQENNISYTELNNENIKRDNSLGEFLNRPLFIMTSLHS